MRRFTIRLEDDLYQMLEEAKGDANVADYIREVLKRHLGGAAEYQRGAEEHLGGAASDLNDLIALYQEELKHFKIENMRLLDLLAREQALHLTTQQKMITGSKEEINKKSWWQFWKK